MTLFDDGSLIEN